MSTLLANLSDAGILERCANRQQSYLRVTPRFLSYAEASGSRQRMIGLPAGPLEALELALAGWEEFLGDVRRGAELLHELLAERDQLGALRPVFPSLEAFGLTAAA